MGQFGSPPTHDDRDDVEADLDRAGSSKPHPVGRQPANPALFVPSHGLGRLAPPVLSARLDLAEHEQVTPSSYHVELALATAKVPLDDLETPAAEMSRRQVLAGAAKLRSSIHRPKVERGWDERRCELALHAWGLGQEISLAELGQLLYV